MPVTYHDRRQRWIADYTDQFGGRHRVSFETRREAKDHLVEAEAAIRDRKFRPSAAKTPLSEIALLFLQEREAMVRRKQLEERSHYNGVVSVEIYINGIRPSKIGNEATLFPFPIGKMNVGDIKEHHIDQFRGALLDVHLKPATVDGHLSTLRSLLKFAVKRGYVGENVAAELEKTRIRDLDLDEDDEVVIPDAATLAKLLETADFFQRLYVRFAMLTGLRSSEQRALQWKHVDLEARQVHVRRRIDGKHVFGPPKSKAGRRSIPLAAQLVNDLVEYHRTLARKGPEDLVFPSAANTALFHPNVLRKVWFPLWQAYLGTTKSPTENAAYCSWHSLRHYAVSSWLKATRDIKQAQKWAGHSSASVTLDVYGHVLESTDNTRAIDAIERGLLERETWRSSGTGDAA